MNRKRLKDNKDQKERKQSLLKPADASVLHPKSETYRFSERERLPAPSNRQSSCCENTVIQNHAAHINEEPESPEEEHKSPVKGLLEERKDDGTMQQSFISTARDH